MSSGLQHLTLLQRTPTQNGRKKSIIISLGYVFTLSQLQLIQDSVVSSHPYVLALQELSEVSHSLN